MQGQTGWGRALQNANIPNINLLSILFGQICILYRQGWPLVLHSLHRVPHSNSKGPKTSTNKKQAWCPYKCGRKLYPGIPCSLQASIVLIDFQKCCSIKPDDLYKMPSGWEFPTEFKKGSREVTSPQVPLSARLSLASPKICHLHFLVKSVFLWFSMGFL